MTENENKEDPEQSSSSPEASVVSQGKGASNSRFRALAWLTVVIFLLGLIWFCYWFFYLRYYEYTDDAYMNGNMIFVNTAVPGSVVAFYADDTDLVKEGQLLILLDKTAYQVAYQKELSTLASIVLQVRQLYDNVSVNRLNVESKRISAEKARFDYENRLHLVGSQAVSNEDFIHSKDDYTIAMHNLEQAEYQLEVALAAAGNTSIEVHPLIEQQKGNVCTAYYNLQHCAIYAPYSGYIAQRNVNVGQWLTPTTNAMAIIPTDYVWVDANFKETQLSHMRIGQSARVWLDLYGSDVEFEGKVLGIASGTGSIFSIIPPQNATGNWIKIVQRLPVRIGLNPRMLSKYPPRLGISAEVNVDITNLDLPMLAQMPPSQPVATTDVFDIDLEEVNKIMNTIIFKNLSKASLKK